MHKQPEARPIFVGSDTRALVIHQICDGSQLSHDSETICKLTVNF